MTIEERISRLEKFPGRAPVENELLAALHEIVALKLELAAVSKRLIALVRGRDL